MQSEGNRQSRAERRKAAGRSNGCHLHPLLLLLKLLCRKLAGSCCTAPRSSSCCSLVIIIALRRAWSLCRPGVDACPLRHLAGVLVFGLGAGGTQLRGG